MIEAHELKKYLEYDPEKGTLTWLRREVKSKADKSFNTRCSGKSAYSRYQPKGRELYYKVVLLKKHYYAHRVCWAIHYGEWPKDGMVVDHINGDGSDNRICNLRVVKQSENARNCKLSKNNTSGFNGVWFSNTYGKWVAELKVNRKKRRIGSYKTKGEAVAAMMAAKKIMGFHDNHGKTKEVRSLSL